ncbi:MAG: tyrosine-type recombinase/integrase [Bacilli bacterium]
MKRDNNWIPEFSSIFKNELKDMIIFKRSNGYQYGLIISYKLAKMDKFFNQISLKKKYINQEIVDLWLKECKSENKATQSKYFSIMADFCKYLRMTSHENIIQPEAHNLRYHSDFIPYIFNEQEIQRMFNIAKKNSSIDQNFETFYVMLSLYYCCGLRFSELHNLQMKDYLDREQKIIINKSKNMITREIPLSASTYDIFNKYIKNNIYLTNEDYVFINNENKRISAYMVRKYYDQLLKDAVIPVRYDGKRQRIHDLRHTFAVNSLKQMEQKGFDLYTSTSVLSVYLGHKSITETEYYLRLVLDEAKNCQEQVKKYTKGLYESKVIYSE